MLHKQMCAGCSERLEFECGICHLSCAPCVQVDDFTKWMFEGSVCTDCTSKIKEVTYKRDDGVMFSTLYGDVLRGESVPMTLISKTGEIVKISGRHSNIVSETGSIFNISHVRFRTSTDQATPAQQCVIR